MGPGVDQSAAPSLSLFATSTQAIATPAIVPGLTTDVYLVLLNVDPTAGTVSLRLTIQPFMTWLWVGGLLVAVGGLVALGPRLTSTLRVGAEPRPGALTGRGTSMNVVSTRLSRPRLVASVVAGLLLIAIMAVVAVGFTRDPSRIESPLIGRTAPEFRLVSLDGATIDLADLRGRPVVLNFWASWCIPCRDEAPLLASAQRRYAAQHVAFLGVVYQDNAASAQAFVDRYVDRLPVTPRSERPDGPRLRRLRDPRDLLHRLRRDDSRQADRARRRRLPRTPDRRGAPMTALARPALRGSIDALLAGAVVVVLGATLLAALGLRPPTLAERTRAPRGRVAMPRLPGPVDRRLTSRAGRRDARRGRRTSWRQGRATPTCAPISSIGTAVGSCWRRIPPGPTCCCGRCPASS